MTGGAWYCIAKTNTFDSGCSIKVAFEDYFIQFSVRVTYGASAINITRCSLPSSAVFSVRLRESDSQWSVDFYSSIDVDSTTTIADSDYWTSVNTSAGAGEVILVINDITSKFNTEQSGGGESLFEIINFGNETEPKYAVVPKNFNGRIVHIYSKGAVASGLPREDEPSGNRGNIGDLNDVDSSASSVFNEDKILLKRAKESQWTLFNLSEIVGLDIEALDAYLSENQFIDAPQLSDALTPILEKDIEQDDRLDTLEALGLSVKEKDGVKYLESALSFYSKGGVASGQPSSDVPTPGGGGGSNVAVTPILKSGEKIATIKVDGVDSDIYAPKKPTHVSELENDAKYVTEDTLADTNTDLTALATTVGGLADTLATEQGYIDTLQGYFENGVAKKATADALGNVIADTYATKVALNAVDKRVQTLEALGLTLEVKDGVTYVKSKYSFYTLGGLASGEPSSSGGGSGSGSTVSYAQTISNGIALGTLTIDGVTTKNTIYAPSALSAYSNDVGYITASALDGYLPKNGGEINSTSYNPLSIHSTNTERIESYIYFSNRSYNKAFVGLVNHGTLGITAQLGISGSGRIATDGLGIYFLPTAQSAPNTVYHSGNFTPSDYLPKAGGTITGALNIYQPSGRSRINLVSQTDNPNDLYFGSNGKEHWSLTSRNSAENYLFALYATHNDGGVRKYVWTADLQTGVVDFTVNATIKDNQILHAGNYSSYALPLSGGTLTSSSSVVLGLDATNNEQNAFVLYHKGAMKTQLGYVVSEGSYIYDYSTRIYLGIDTNGAAYCGTSAYVSSNNHHLLIHSGNIGSYNAGSATKLQTARTIWGQSFDGSGDVNGDLYSSGWIRTYNTKGWTNTTYGAGMYADDYTYVKSLGDRAFFTKGFKAGYNYDNDSRAKLDLISQSDNACDLWLGSNSARQWSINVRASNEAYYLGFYNPTYTQQVLKLYQAGGAELIGNFEATGGIASRQPSDARLKNNVQVITTKSAIDVLRALNPISFEWNKLAQSLDKRNEGWSVGFIAQDFEQTIPNSGSAIWEKYRAIDYTKAIPYLAKGWQVHDVILVKHADNIEDLRSRVKVLEKENRELKQRLNMRA